MDRIAESILSDRKSGAEMARLGSGGVCLRKATMIASSSGESTVEFCSFGPVGRSATEVRLFHSATVFRLIP